MIWTSYYAKTKQLEERFPERRLLGISIGLPPWVKGVGIFPILSPPPRLVREYKEGNIDEEQYTKIYNRLVLSKLNCEEVASELQNSVLLCYESPIKFCHRHLVRKWFQKHGFPCEEVIF